MRLLAVLAFAGWGWVVRLGGLGLILVGLIDNSFIPIPGGMDLLTLLLSAHRKEWWWYYAIMSTIGSLIGGYLTFRLGRKGGEKTLEKRVPHSETERVYRIFRKFGFWAIFVPALLPPPVPIVPFLLAPGILEYSPRRFLLALGLSRGVRYTLIAYLGSRYGGGVFHWFGRYYKPILIVLIALGFLAGGVVIWYVMQRKRAWKKQRKSRKQPASKVA